MGNVHGLAANQSVTAEHVSKSAAIVGVSLDSAGRALHADGGPVHDGDFSNLPSGVKVDYAALPSRLNDALAAKAHVDDHDKPPHLPADHPDVIEFEQARAALVKLNETLADPTTPDPSLDDRILINDRYKLASEKRARHLAEWRQHVQVAHGVPIGDDNALTFGTSQEA